MRSRCVIYLSKARGSNGLYTSCLLTLAHASGLPCHLKANLQYISTCLYIGASLMRGFHPPLCIRKVGKCEEQSKSAKLRIAVWAKIKTCFSAVYLLAVGLATEVVLLVFAPLSQSRRALVCSVSSKIRRTRSAEITLGPRVAVRTLIRYEASGNQQKQKQTFL